MHRTTLTQLNDEALITTRLTLFTASLRLDLYALSIVSIDKSYQI